MSPAVSSRVRVVAFLIAAGVLSAAFLEHAPNRERIYFQADSENLVVGSLVRAAYSPEPRSSAAATFMSRSDGTPYLSQFGLQKRVLALLLSPGPAMIDGLERAWITVGILAALVLAWWIAFEAERSGPVAALCVLGMLALSPWVALFSTILYWSSFLFYLPFVVVWTTRSGPAGPPRWLGPVVMALVGIKSLCGYEYLSAIVGGASAAAVWRDLSEGASLPGTLTRAFRIGLWGVAGFAAALSMHVVAASVFKGSLAEGIAASFEAAAYRTVGDVLNKPTSLVNDAATWLTYFEAPAVRDVAQGWLLLAVAAAGVFVWWTEKGALRLAVAFGLPLALLASLSWNLLALGHMRYHRHINAITFYLPFNLVGFLVIGLAASRLLGLIPWPWRGEAPAASE